MRNQAVVNRRFLQNFDQKIGGRRKQIRKPDINRSQKRFPKRRLPDPFQIVDADQFIILPGKPVRFLKRIHETEGKIIASGKNTRIFLRSDNLKPGLVSRELPQIAARLDDADA